jgi:hypothetical protein
MEKIIACTLGRADLAEQRRRWAALAEQAPVERVVLPNGLRLTFGGDVVGPLEELVAVERDCCAFADWAIHGRADRTVLEITSDEDAISIVQQMFA